jgi:nucleoside phosphorylase
MNTTAEAPIALVGIRSELGQLREQVDVSGETLHPWGRLALGRWQPGNVAVALVTTAIGDQVIFQGQRKRWLHQTFGALAVENEGVAGAQVAHCHDLPWLVLRGVSDTADGEAAYDFTQLIMYDDDLEQSPRVVQAALTLRQGARSPALLLRAARFRQGQKQAMTAIAVLLNACLPFL